MLALIVSQLSTLFSHQRCCQEAKAEGPQENSLLSKQAVFKSLFEWVQCFMKSRVETPTCFQNVPVSEVSKWNLFKVYFIIYSVHRSREDKSEAKFVFNACSLSKEVAKIDHHQNCYYWRIALSFLTKTKAQKVTKYKLSFRFKKKWGKICESWSFCMACL